MHKVLKIMPLRTTLMKFGRKRNNDKIFFYLDKILENQYYTESGPLVLELEHRLTKLLSVKNVIAVSNVSVAWLLVLEAAGLRGGDLFVTRNLHADVLSVLNFLECRPIPFDLVFYKSDEHNILKDAFNGHQSNANVLLTNRYSGAQDLHLANLNGNIGLRSSFLDSTDSFLSKYQDSSTNYFVKAEVISPNLPYQAKGESSSFIATNSEYLADYLRCMRGSGGVITKVDTTLNANGRMTEGQAAFLLAYLDNLDEEIENNKQVYKIYNEAIKNKIGLQVLSAKHASYSGLYSCVFSAKHKELEVQIIQNAKKKGVRLEEEKSNYFTGYLNSQQTHFILPTNIHTRDASHLISMLLLEGK